MTPFKHLTRLSNQFPKFWRQYDEFRAERESLGGWPAWCYCPLAGAYAIVSGGGSNRVPLERAGIVGELGAVAAWRPTKGIYQFDPDLAAALVSTPFDRELPAAAIERLPEWGVWIDPVAGLPGFFAFLEHDASTERAELRLAIDDYGGLTQLIVHLGAGSLRDGLEAMVLEASANAALQSRMAVPVLWDGDTISEVARISAPFVALVLYLCADEPDYGGRPAPAHPSRVKRKHAAEVASVWTVGERIGAALRSSTRASEAEGEGTHASPRPHVRRAHWHAYWTEQGRATLRIKWLSPILIGAGDTVVTSHEVD